MGLEVKELSVFFEGKTSLIAALDQINFSLEPGKTLALLGESGSGKSLTALALMRLLPQQSFYGRSSVLNYADIDLLNLPEYLMRRFRGRRLAMIFQEPMTALNPVMTIGQQLAETLKVHEALSHQASRDRILSILEEVELPDPQTRLKFYPHQLSGGQKQRVVIAMALLCRPDILIADEPTTALDVTIQAQILKLLKKLQAQYQMSLLLITHDLSVVKTCADQVLVIYAGQVIEYSPADLFFSKPLHPYVQKMLGSLPAFAKRMQILSPIPGKVPSLDALPSGCRFHPRCGFAFESCFVETPPLIEVDNGRSIRCHLYPFKAPVFEEDAPIHWQDQAQSKVPEPKQAASVIISVKDLEVSFTGKSFWPFKNPEVFKAVDGLSFELSKGQTLALVGESGSGKTTVCRVLLRFQGISAGSLVYREQDLMAMRGRALKEYRKKVQIVFQDPYSSMNPRMMIGEILAEGLIAQGYRAAMIRKKQIEVLDQVNLAESSLLRYPHQFSGGQRQRICIARALVVEPDVLICDEPTSALDVSVQAQILNLLKILQKEKGMAYLFVTHNMGVVSYMADDVLVMRQGRAVESGTCEQIFKKPQNPYTKELISAISD